MVVIRKAEAEATHLLDVIEDIKEKIGQTPTIEALLKETHRDVINQERQSEIDVLHQLLRSVETVVDSDSIPRRAMMRYLR